VAICPALNSCIPSLKDDLAEVLAVYKSLKKVVCVRKNDETRRLVLQPTHMRRVFSSA